VNGLREFLKNRVNFSAKTWPEKITLIAVIVGEVAIGVIIIYAVIVLPLR